MSKMQREKGKRYEREVSEVLRGFGLPARRGVQFSGGKDSPDVVGIPGVHLECKHHQALSIHKAMRQAARECGENVPAVVHRVNRGESCITIRLADLPVFLDKFDEAVEAGKDLSRVVHPPAGDGGPEIKQPAAGEE